MVGSGSAERNWKDVSNVLTKNRNRMTSKRCIDLVYVRTWLRRELKALDDEDLECFKEWEVELLRQASGEEAQPAAAAESPRRIFKDRFEDWEQDAIDGSASNPRLSLGNVKRNKRAMFRLQEKYKDMFFVDKDAEGDNDYYEPGGGDGPLAEDKWEHRKILGLIWQNNHGWRVETKICDNMSGPSNNYLINDVLVRMIKESTRNITVTFRSEM